MSPLHCLWWAVGSTAELQQLRTTSVKQIQDKVWDVETLLELQDPPSDKAQKRQSHFPDAQTGLWG